MKLRTELVSDASQLSEACRQRWNELAQNPFQGWEWLGSWAEAYSSDNSLAILRVTAADGRILGFAPFCLENRLASGRTVAFLGSGKACSDHLSILAEEGKTTAVCRAIADWLVHQEPDGFVWDYLELVGVDSHDLGVDLLADALEHRGVSVEIRDGLGCYAIDLPPTWDEYVQMRSKSGRREIRQALRMIDEGKIQVQQVLTMEQLVRRWPEFVSLHQKRRAAAGTDGCFDHPNFGAFLRSAAERLLAQGKLRFVFAIADGRPVAVHFAVADGNGWYFYQSGMEPDSAELRPGLSLFCHSIRSSITSGLRVFDMMRGDEPYKLRWRATLRPTQEVRAFNPRLTSQVRGGVMKVGSAIKSLLSLSPGWTSSTT